MEKFTPSIIYWDKGLKGQSQVNSFPGTELRMNFKKTYSWTILSDVIIPEQHDQISESNYWTVCLIVHISESSNWTVCLKELVFKSNYWTACSESDKRISESNYWTTCSLFRSTSYWNNVFSDVLISESNSWTTDQPRVTVCIITEHQLYSKD